MITSLFHQESTVSVGYPGYAWLVDHLHALIRANVSRHLASCRFRVSLPQPFAFTLLGTSLT